MFFRPLGDEATLHRSAGVVLPRRNGDGVESDGCMPRPPLRLHPALSSDELISSDELSVAEEDEASAFIAEVNARLSIGKLPQIVRSPSTSTATEEETPVDGPGAVENWLGLVDHAQVLQAQALAAKPMHPVLERTTRRALRSVLLYEHQITSRARHQARQALWRWQHTGPLPPLEVLLTWGQCRCATCQQERAATPMAETALAAVAEQTA